MSRQATQPKPAAALPAVAAPIRNALNSPLAMALGVTLLYACFVGARWYLLGGDVSRFVMASAQFISAPAGASVGLRVLPSGLGYDGQFYYLLAFNPFSPHVALPGARFDVPAYRAQRILYPLVVWALSLGGRPALVPVMLVAVNLAAIAAIAAFSAALARRFGAAPLWGALVALYPGLVVSLAGDLSEPLALACALGGIFFATDRRWAKAAVLFSLAALSRETTLLIPLALLGAALMARVVPREPLRWPALRLIARQDWRGSAVAGLIPLVVASAWQVTLLARWGEVGALAHGVANLGPPGVGMVEALLVWGAVAPPALQLPLYADFTYLVGLFEFVRRWLRRTASALRYVALAWAIYAALTLALSLNVWDLYWNFLRGASELGVLSLLLLMFATPRARWVVLGATVVAWALTAGAAVGVTAPAL